MEYLFVYGTLQDPQVQQRIIGRIVTGTPDTLDGFFKSRIAMSDGIFPLVIPQHGSSVEGMVLEVTAAELARMDIYETSAYRRIRVRLRSGQETWVYA
jgi:gamma-glutamylcyclotransferase (GGCT)/AIG2-like uncharacterized protein YtfP